jgi:hypothetical protein
MVEVWASKLGTETMNCAVVAVPQRHLSAYPCLFVRYVTSRYGDLLMLISRSFLSFPIWCAMGRVYTSKLGTGTMDSAVVTLPQMQIKSYHCVLSSVSWRHCCSCSGCPSFLLLFCVVHIALLLVRVCIYLSFYYVYYMLFYVYM